MTGRRGGTDPPIRGVPVSCSHVRNDLALAAARRRLPPLRALDDLTAQLESVNEALWQIEDDIRAREAAQDFGPAFVTLARAVYQANDRRTALKHQIDAPLASERAERKAYTPYAPPATLLDRRLG